jgi:hypothetical protein
LVIAWFKADALPSLAVERITINSNPENSQPLSQLKVPSVEPSSKTTTRGIGRASEISARSNSGSKTSRLSRSLKAGKHTATLGDSSDSTKYLSVAMTEFNLNEHDRKKY